MYIGQIMSFSLKLLLIMNFPQQIRKTVVLQNERVIYGVAISIECFKTILKCLGRGMQSVRV